MAVAFVLGMAALVLIAIAAVVVWGYREDLSSARAAARQGARLVDTAFGPIEYAEAGKGAPLLAIHGAGGGWDQGLALAQAFVGEGFRIIAPSRFGYLRTPAPHDVSPAAQADAHADLLDALGAPKAIVFGFSAGARSAIELAIRHPERVSRLVLIVPAAASPGALVSVDESRGSRLALRFVTSGADFAWWAAAKLAPVTLLRFLGVPPATVARAPRDEHDRALKMVASIEPLSLRFPGVVVDSDQTIDDAPLERVAAPTLIVSARDDLFKTAGAASYAARRILGAKLILYDDGGHLLLGRLEEARAAVRAFLVEPATARASRSCKPSPPRVDAGETS